MLYRFVVSDRDDGLGQFIINHADLVKLLKEDYEVSDPDTHIKMSLANCNRMHYVVNPGEDREYFILPFDGEMPKEYAEAYLKSRE